MDTAANFSCFRISLPIYSVLAKRFGSSNDYVFINGALSSFEKALAAGSGNSDEQ